MCLVSELGLSESVCLGSSESACLGSDERLCLNSEVGLGESVCSSVRLVSARGCVLAQ